MKVLITRAGVAKAAITITLIIFIGYSFTYSKPMDFGYSDNEIKAFTKYKIPDMTKGKIWIGDYRYKTKSYISTKYQKEGLLKKKGNK